MNAPANSSFNPLVGSTAVVVPQTTVALTSAPLPDSTIQRDRMTIWNVPFDRVTLDQSVDAIEGLIARRKPSYVITANLNYAMLNERHEDVRQITKDADLILADGQPIVWRSRLESKPLPERVAGSELIYRLAERCRDRGYRVYFLGGAPGVAVECARQLKLYYPGLKIAGVESPPFRELTEEEQQAQDDRIRRADTDLLLVAFGQPKGERWIHQHYRKLGVPVSIQPGASFDFIAGTAFRAPAIWQRLGLEWLYRMASDPRRLVPRYLANGIYLMSALVEDWKRLVTSWGMGNWVDQPVQERRRAHR
jgi:N-acetylglucosaminyldiphosphoundecaprenol N-acetyl-beta-D-mannosaminyltransferase